MADVTRILSQIEQGDSNAAEQLLPLVYEELRKLAAARMAQEKPGQTLQATALVHEAYLRLVARPGGAVGNALRGVPPGETNPAESSSSVPSPQPLAPPVWDSRGHFFAAAAEAMRRILIEQARRKRTQKAGSASTQVELADIADESPSDPLDLLALDEALQKLQRQSPRRAELVKLRYFAGLTIEEAAEALGVSPSTANADWVFAKSWLCLEMRSAD